jgi:deoxyribodipyrimidine photolyase-related protein
MSNVLVILFPNQLFEKKYIKKIFSNDETDLKIKSKHILLWEHEYFFTYFLYHKMKLILHRASMKNYYDLISNEYEKKYIEYKNSEEINLYIKKNKIDKIRFFNPIEKFMINYI